MLSSCCEVSVQPQNEGTSPYIYRTFDLHIDFFIFYFMWQKSDGFPVYFFLTKMLQLCTDFQPGEQKNAQYILYPDEPKRVLSGLGMKNAWHPHNEQLAIDPNLQFLCSKENTADNDLFIAITVFSI